MVAKVSRSCRRASRGERCGDLVAYMPGLTHARHDDASGRVQTKLAGGHKVVAQTGLECVDGARLDIENIGGERE